MSGDDIIVSQNIRIGCTHENTKVLFSDLFTRGPGFRLPKLQIHLDEMPIRYKILTYTAKFVSVCMGPHCDCFLYDCVEQKID